MCFYFSTGPRPTTQNGKCRRGGTEAKEGIGREASEGTAVLLVQCTLIKLSVLYLWKWASVGRDSIFFPVDSTLRLLLCKFYICTDEVVQDDDMDCFGDNIEFCKGH